MPVSAINSASLSTSHRDDLALDEGIGLFGEACRGGLAGGTGTAGSLQKRHVKRRAGDVVRIVEQGFARTAPGGRLLTGAVLA
jgi:hypothetical protein